MVYFPPHCVIWLSVFFQRHLTSLKAADGREFGRDVKQRRQASCHTHLKRAVTKKSSWTTNERDCVYVPGVIYLHFQGEFQILFWQWGDRKIREFWEWKYAGFKRIWMVKETSRFMRRSLYAFRNLKEKDIWVLRGIFLGKEFKILLFLCK